MFIYDKNSIIDIKEIKYARKGETNLDLEKPFYLKICFKDNSIELFTYSSKNSRDKLFNKILNRPENVIHKWTKFNGQCQIEYYDVITNLGECYYQCWPMNKQFWPQEKNVSIAFSEVVKIKLSKNNPLSEK